MQRMLITGGAGFIGVNAARYFADRGWEVVLLDNLSRRGVVHNLERLNKENPERFQFIKADVRYDQDILDKEVAVADAVLHLAAQVAVTTSVTDPRLDFEINALGTLNMLEALRKAPKPPVFIYSSTNKVYGEMEEAKIGEKDTRYHLHDLPNGVSERQQLDFHSPYGCSKGAADEYVRDYGRIYNLPTVVFRQSCIYGPHQYGIEDQGWLAWFIISLLREKPVTIYGTGKQVRDVLYVGDLLALYERAIEKIADARGHAFNIGGGMGNSLSLLEFFTHLEGSRGLKASPSFGDERPGDQKVFVSDNTKVKNILGWEPKTSVHDGIKSLHGWVEESMPLIKSLY